MDNPTSDKCDALSHICAALGALSAEGTAEHFPQTIHMLRTAVGRMQTEWEEYDRLKGATANDAVNN